MKVTFIHHSSFLVETPSLQLLFDYYEGPLPEFDRKKPLYVLASHSHGDHYGKVIYSLPEKHPDVRYVLSFDIPEGHLPAGFRCPVRHMVPHEEFQDSFLKVSTLKSNDRGVAFVLQAADGSKIYHGGDLNNWYWDRGPVALEDERIYHEELSRIEGMDFDAAFVPLDPRLQNYHIGMDNFMEHVTAKAVFPMHFWGQFDLIGEFLTLPTTAPYREHVMKIERDGQVFEL